MSNLNIESPDGEFKLIVELLKQSFTVKDTAKHKEILSKLKELYKKDPLNHLQILIKGLTLDDIQIQLEVKKSIALYINNIVNAHREDLGIKALLELLKFVLQSLIFSDNNASIHSLFHKTIVLLIGSKCLMEKSSFFKEVFDYLQSTISINQCPKDQLVKRSKDVIDIIQSIIKCEIMDRNTIATMSNQIFAIMDSFFSIVPNYINVNSGINVKFIDLLKALYECFNALIKKIKFEKKEEIDILFLFEKYGLYTWELINLNILNNGGNNMIYLNNDAKLDNQVNLMKGKAIQFIASLLNVNRYSIKNNDLIIYTSKLINGILTSLDGLIKNHFKLIQDLRDEQLTDGLNLIVYSMSLFLLRALIRDPVKEQFSPLVNNFILNIIFPFLLSTPADINELKDDGESYFNYMADLVQDQKIKSCRASMAFLLQKICDNYGFVSSMVLNFILQYFENLLNDNKTELPQNQFSMLVNSNSPIITIDYEYKIDFCLLVLILLEDHFVDSKLFKQRFRTIFLNHYIKLNGMNSVLVMDKLCLFYGIFIQILFEEGNYDDDYKFNSIVFDYLMSILLNYTKCEGLGYQSANAIYDILYQNDLGKELIFSDIINQNISKINMLIEESDVHLFYSILVYIEERIDFNSIEAESELLTNVTKRMLKEIKEIDQYNQMSLFLEKGFVILNKFLQKTKLTNDKNSKLNIERFESMITPIVLYIKNPNKIIFEDYIIDLMEKEIISTKMIPPLPLSILPFLQLTCKKNKMLSQNEYSFLCSFMKYDSNGKYTTQCLNEIVFLIYLGYQLDNAPNILSLLLTIGLLSCNSTLGNDKEMLISLLSKAYLNISNWNITSFKKSLLDDTPECVLLSSFAVICTSMITRPLDTFDFLIESDSGQSFYLNLGNITKIKFSSTKLMKQIILGLCSLVHTPETQQKLIQMQSLNRILNFTLHFTLSQKKEDISHLKTMMFKEINCNFINNEEENSIDNDMDDLRGYFNNEFMSNENNPIDTLLRIKEIAFGHENIDEYLTFTQCVKGLDKKLLENYVIQLSDLEKQKLSEICLIRKVDVVYHEKKISVPRRTVKIKRNINEQGDGKGNKNLPEGENKDNKIA